jgi:hypothetical protein
LGKMIIPAVRMRVPATSPIYNSASHHHRIFENRASVNMKCTPQLSGQLLQNYFTQPGYQTNRGSSSLRRYSHAASVIFFRSYIGRQPSRNLAFALSSQFE